MKDAKNELLSPLDENCTAVWYIRQGVLIQADATLELWGKKVLYLLRMHPLDLVYYFTVGSDIFSVIYVEGVICM